MKHVAIIGGGSAGLSAALTLGRALRNIVVITHGKPRNFPASNAHSLLGREGINPMELVETGRKEISAFETVEIVDKKAIAVRRLESGGFAIQLEDEAEVLAEKLILAYGVVDKLPGIPGLEEIWGKNLFHCPYCHAYEVKHEPLAVHSVSEKEAYEFVLLVRNWSQNLVLFSHGEKVLTPAQSEHLKALDVKVYDQKIASVEQNPNETITIVLEDGSKIERKALFMRPKVEQRCTFAKDLECEFTEAGFIKVDGFQKTSVPGVYAAGDCAGMIHQVSIAIAQGTVAGAMVNHELIAKLKV